MDVCIMYNRLLSVNVYAIINANNEPLTNREILQKIVDRHYRHRELTPYFEVNLFKRIQAATNQLFKTGFIARHELKTPKKTIFYTYTVNEF